MKYFGYGANKTPEMMKAITGNSQLVGEPAVLSGYDLGIQRFDQIPDKVLSGSMLPASPREIIRGAWKDPEKFETYVIKPGESAVDGTVWELTDVERELVRNWELVGDWYKEIMAKVRLEDGTKIEIQTEILGDGQGVDRLVDGLIYPPFLNDIREFEGVANRVREETLERIKASREGSSTDPEKS